MVEAPAQKFYRSSSDKWIAGVCGGLARYWRIDPTLLRVLWIVGSILTIVGGIVAYILLTLLTEER